MVLMALPAERQSVLQIMGKRVLRWAESGVCLEKELSLDGWNGFEKESRLPS